nr:scarecrow-like protein 18 [Quercus suber]
MRKAGEKFIHSISQIADGLSILSHPFGFSFYGLSNEETKDVELAEFLFTAAEKVACQQFDRTSKLLNRCDQWSSNTGNPVQRLVPQFAGIQAIVENVAEARKIHIIDSSIRSGVQWTIFMQALTTRSECPLELLKITAVGITSKHLIEETAESAGMYNGSALFFYAAYFDCLETSMKENESHRMILESEYFGEAIMNILAAEGEERKVRNVKIDVWRAFFARYGMVEAELSMSSLYQANMVVQKFDCKSFCTLDMNAKSLIIGWKGGKFCVFYSAIPFEEG